MPIRSYTATLIIPAAGTAGTVQFGNIPVYDAAAQAIPSTGTPVNGRLYGVQIAFGGGTATTLTIATAGQGGPVETLLSLSNVKTDSWFYPRATTQNVNGVSNGTTIVDQFPVDDIVTFAISAGGAAGTYVARLLLHQ